MIPTCEVRIQVSDSGGGAGLAGSVVEATLNRFEWYQGVVVPRTVVVKTDKFGRASMRLFPNVLGSDGSRYDVKITAPGGRTTRLIARVPNQPFCDLDDIVIPKTSDDDSCCGNGGDSGGVILYRQNQFLENVEQQTASENIGFGDLAPDLLAAFMDGAGITSGGPTYEGEHLFGVTPSTDIVVRDGIAYDGAQSLTDIQKQRAFNNIGFGSMTPDLIGAFSEAFA